MVIILTLTQTNKVNIIWSNSIAKEGLQLSLLVLIPLDFNHSSKRRNNENESLKWVHQRVIFWLKLSRSRMFSITALVLFIFEFEFRFFKHQATFEFACADWVCRGRSIVRLEIYFTTYFWSSARHCFCISLQVKPYLVQARRHAFSTKHGLKTAGFCVSQNHE